MTDFIDGFATNSGEVLVYRFAVETGEYLGQAAVHVSEGCGLSPGQVLDAPPSAYEGFAVQRTADAWAIVEDHRGTVYRTSDGAPVEHTQLGNLPVDLTTEPRPTPNYVWDGTQWIADLVKLHQNKTIEINRACQAAITVGFWSESLGGAHHYSGALDDQLNLTVAILGNQDSIFGCRNEQGLKDYRLHSIEQLHHLGRHFSAFKMGHLQRANDLKQQLDQALADGDLQTLENTTWHNESEQP